jgi:hypothetical protein
MNPVGLVAGSAAFLGIWGGHVVVRKVEATSPTIWIPAISFVLLGGLLEWFAFSAHSSTVSVGTGILGITCFWDAFEIIRQEKRVRIGHAPANPANPRHKRILEASESQATTLELLKREPLG